MINDSEREVLLFQVVADDHLEQHEVSLIVSNDLILETVDEIWICSCP